MGKRQDSLAVTGAASVPAPGAPLPAAAGRQDWFSARELADLAQARGIKGWPHSHVASLNKIRGLGWSSLGEHLARARPSKGGRAEQEYHVSLLPDALQAAVHGLAGVGRQVAAVARDAEADRRRVAALRVAALPARARTVLEARAEILTAIEGFAATQGKGRAWAIAQFFEAQTEWLARQEAEAARDAGLSLTAREAADLARPLMLTTPGGFGLDPARLALANDRRGSAQVKRSAVYDWFKARDAGGILALAPKPPKVEEPVPAAFFDFMRFYALPSKPSVSDAHREYVKEAGARAGVQPMTLTLDQVRRILRDRLNHIEKHVGREGILTLKARMSYVTRTTDDMWPTTIYTADGKTFDAEVADPVSQKPMRPEITSVLDVATRKCVGYAVSRKENVIAVTEALRRSCAAHGICAIFYTDRGAGYRNKTFDADVGGLMGRLGITKMHALPYNSQAKGIIERFNHVWNDVARRMPSYIGRDMDKEAGTKVHKVIRLEVRQFGQSRHLPSWAEFIAAVEAEISAYNDRPHSGLPKFDDPASGKRRHMTPNEAWDMHVAAGFEPVTILPEEEDDLFRPYEIRTVRRALVEWNTNTYFHEALEPLHGSKVAVGYDLHQADRVWVRAFDVASGQPGQLICVARFGGNSESYVPRTFAQAALETRQKTSLKRLERKVRDKQAEMEAPALLESRPETPAAFLDPVPSPAAEPEPACRPPEAAVVPAAPRRRVFASDEALAAWALENPGDLSPNQISVLRDCLSRPEAREHFRLSGIDVEALRTLLRAVA